MCVSVPVCACMDICVFVCVYVCGCVCVCVCVCVHLVMLYPFQLNRNKVPV